MRILFTRNLAYAKFRENKTLAKISEFTIGTYLFCKKALLTKYREGGTTSVIFRVKGVLGGIYNLY